MRQPWRKALAALGAVLALSGSGCGRDAYAPDPQAQEGSYEGGGPAVMDGEMKKTEGASSFRIQVNANPQADVGEKLPFFVGNPRENKWDVRVCVYLEDTGEQVYASPVLHPGQREPYGEPEIPLEAGEYPAVAVFFILDRESGEQLGTVEAGIVITVE